MDQRFDRQGTNIATVEQLDLMEHWRNPVMLLRNHKDPVVGGVVNIYLTTESINQRVAEMHDTTGITYCQLTCIQAVHIAMNQMCNGLVIGGLAPEEVYITKEELMKIKEPVDGIIKMMEILSGVVQKQAAFGELQEMEFYMLGELSNEAFDTHIEEVDVTRGEGEAYDLVKLYIIKDHAEAENTRNLPLNRYPFREIVSYLQGRYGISIEPYEEYHVEFCKDELVAYR